jgi:hypothetical protein
MNSMPNVRYQPDQKRARLITELQLLKLQKDVEQMCRNTILELGLFKAVRGSFMNTVIDL